MTNAGLTPRTKDGSLCDLGTNAGLAWHLKPRARAVSAKWSMVRLALVKRPDPLVQPPCFQRRTARPDAGVKRR